MAHSAGGSAREEVVFLMDEDEVRWLSRGEVSAPTIVSSAVGKLGSADLEPSKSLTLHVSLS